MWFDFGGATSPSMAPNAVGMAPRDADTDATATLQRAAMSERGVRIKRTPSFKERAFADSEKASGGGRAPRPPASPEQKSRRDGFRQKSKATPLALLSHAVEASPVVEPQRTERSVGGALRGRQAAVRQQSGLPAPPVSQNARSRRQSSSSPCSRTISTHRRSG